VVQSPYLPGGRRKGTGIATLVKSRRLRDELTPPEGTKEYEAMASEHWKNDPEAEDFPSAQSYLSLLVGLEAATKLAKALRKQKRLCTFAAKDILRASGLALLPSDDSEVSSDLEKVKRGEKLSPVLLVQGDPLWVADGYHRICVSYHLDEKEPVPCRIVPR
jgi:hypothetical protein